MTDLNHPAVRMGVGVGHPLPPLLTTGADVRLVALGASLLPTYVEVIALVRTQMLRCLSGGLWALDHHGFEGVRQQPHVVAVGGRDDDGNRHPMPFRQDTALGAPFATVRGIGPRGLPPNGALVIAPSMLCQVHSSPARSS
jgi:hypothetical protein